MVCSREEKEEDNESGGESNSTSTIVFNCFRSWKRYLKDGSFNKATCSRITYLNFKKTKFYFFRPIVLYYKHFLIRKERWIFFPLNNLYVNLINNLNAFSLSDSWHVFFWQWKKAFKLDKEHRVRVRYQAVTFVRKQG